MKADYCQTTNCHKDIKRQLLQDIDIKIISIFQDHTISRYAKMEDLYSYLQKRKAIGGLQNAFKQKFFKTLLEQQLKEFNFIKTLDQYTLKVLKMTKCKLKDFTIDWRQIIRKLEDSNKTTNKLSRLYSFLRIVRDYYDQNNAMDVFDHFLGNYKFSDEITWVYMEQFINLTKNTKPEIANELLTRLKEFYEFDSVKDICYYRWLVKIKRKLPQLVMGKYLDDLNHQILNELILTHNKQKSLLTTISAKFLTSIFAKFIGKTNPKSVQMINWFFKIYQSGVSAFEDKKTALKMIKNFLGPLWKRKTKQDTLRKKLEKKDEQEVDDEKDTDMEKQHSKDDKQKQKQEKVDLIENAIGTMVLMNESEDEDQEDQIDQSLPAEEKQQIRAQKLSQLQADELTPQIMDALKTNLESILQDLFFTPNKEVANVLKYIYFLFPELAQKSIQYLGKGMDIDQYNFAIHMKNAKKIVQYLFVFGERERLLENILTILSEVIKIRYVKDAWNLLCYISMKIPCLDEEDCKTVSQQVKKEFQNNFKIGHDLFYQKYSEAMFELFKRFIKETEVKEKKSLLKQDNPYLGFAFNVYPEFDKRCLQLVISNYIDNPNPFIYNYLELKVIPEKYIDNFLPELKQSETQQQAITKFSQLLIASRSVSFQRLSKIIQDSAQHQSSKHGKYLFSIIQNYFNDHIHINPVMSPIESSLSYLWKNDAKYEIILKNTNIQSVEDSLKRIIALWREQYQQLSKFVEAHKKTLEQEIDPTEVVKKFYFSTDNPNFQLRKKLIWRIQIIEVIIQNMPSSHLVWSDSRIFQQLKFRQFPQIKEVTQKTPQLAEDLLRIFLIEFPHEYKVISRLETLVIYSSNVLDNLDQCIYQFKDVVRVIKNNQSVNHTNLYLALLKQANKFVVYNQAYRSIHTDHNSNKKIAELVEVAFLHPDQQAVGQFVKQEDYDITGLLLDLLKIKLPQNTEDNKIKLFHQKLSSQLTFLFEKPRTRIDSGVLLQIMALVINFITSSEKSIRQGYLDTLKNLLVIIQDVKIDQKSLSIISQGLLSASSKQKLVWAIGLIFLQENIVNFQKFYPMLNQLLFSDDFLLRKYSQFLLSYIIRVDRLKYQKTTTLQNLGQYKQKTLDEFLQTGYLRPEHIDLNIKKKKIKMKYRSYDKCIIKQKSSIKESLSFILDPQKALKFVKQYQTDQVSSEDQLMLKKKFSFSQVSELADIFTWLKSRYSKVVDISQHRFTSYQSIFGQRFFKYIFQNDYQNGFPFFKATKEFIQTVCLPNLQTLDNQVVVINYISMLLKAYSKYHKTIHSQEVDNFILKSMGEIIEKSSGQFFNFFRKLSLLNVEELPLLVNFFKKYLPTHPNYYRTVQIRLVWFSHKRQQLIEILNDIFKAGKNLQNTNVSKLIRQIILFNEKHFFNEKQINQCKVLNLKQLEEKKEIIKQTEHIYTASRRQFDEVLVKNLKRLISSQQIQDRKTGNDLLDESIKTYLLLQKSKANLEALNTLLILAVELIITNKEEYKNEEDLFESTLAFMLCQVFPENQFPLLLQTLKKLLVPIPKVSNYLKVFYKNPYNLIRLSEENYQQFIKKLLTLLQNNLRFKQLLTTLSGLLYFRRPKVEDIGSLGCNQRQVLTLYMSLILSDVRHLAKYEKELEKIVNSKEKDKMKTWATIMINSRGKRQILEDQESHKLWKRVKDVSNPYFYHC